VPGVCAAVCSLYIIYPILFGEEGKGGGEKKKVKSFMEMHPRLCLPHRLYPYKSSDFRDFLPNSIEGEKGRGGRGKRRKEGGKREKGELAHNCIDPYMAPGVCIDQWNPLLYHCRSDRLAILSLLGRGKKEGGRKKKSPSYVAPASSKHLRVLRDAVSVESTFDPRRLYLPILNHFRKGGGGQGKEPRKKGGGGGRRKEGEIERPPSTAGSSLPTKGSPIRMRLVKIEKRRREREKEKGKKRGGERKKKRKGEAIQKVRDFAKKTIPSMVPYQLADRCPLPLTLTSFNFNWRGGGKEKKGGRGEGKGEGKERNEIMSYRRH